MEFREISTFLQVAQYQSFSKAARHLGYSRRPSPFRSSSWSRSLVSIFLTGSENRFP